MIALLNNCLVAKTSRAIFFHPYCLYSDVTATLNQLPVQEIPGPVETKSLWEFDQTLSQRSDWVKGLAREATPVLGFSSTHCGHLAQSFESGQALFLVFGPRNSVYTVNLT